MITKAEQEQIKAILQDPKWQTIEHLANEYCDKVSYDAVVGSSQWDTLRNALMNEGRVRGVKEFIKELYDLLQKNQDAQR